jgi:hypothetical protein
MSGLGTTDTVALTVHGEHGAVDLVVPLGATVADVSREYAARCGLPVPPHLTTSTGRTLAAGLSLAVSGVVSGGVLIAMTGGPAQPTPAQAREQQAREREADLAQPGAGSAAWFAVAAVMGVLAAVLVAGRDDPVRDWVAGLLAAAAVVGVLPLGRYADVRATSAPAFAGAAAYAIAWQPGAAYHALTFGIAGLAAAVAAGVARALGAERTEAHNVWIAGGTVTFLVTGAGVLGGYSPQVAWSLLLTLCVLAARLVPAFAIDVPDQMLIDLEKLAVTAWSARDRTAGRRGRMVIPEAGISDLMARGWRIVDAATAGILMIVVVSLPSLNAAVNRGADRDIDRYGVLALAFFAGASFLLAARSYRHALAAGMLRAAGVYAWVVLAVLALRDRPDADLMLVAVVALVLACGVLASAVATGRGWRSVWWARKAEVAEVLCGSGAVAAFFVASAVFRHMWEFTS